MALEASHSKLTVSSPAPSDSTARKLTAIWQESLRCGDSEKCEISKGDYKTWTISADLTGGSNWIAGGFSVEKSFETGTEKTCEGQQGGKVCLWIKIAHTEVRSSMVWSWC